MPDLWEFAIWVYVWLSWDHDGNRCQRTGIRRLLLLRLYPLRSSDPVSALRSGAERGRGAGAGIVGSAFALIAAIWFVETPVTEEEALAADLGRGAYVQALSELDPDVLVQSRGVGQVAVWFNVPDDVEGECGEYPAGV